MSLKTSRRLSRKFFVRPTLEVARNLIGKYLVYRPGRQEMVVRLVEVEAYIGEDDPACHAAVGKTARNEVMYGIGGHGYIYFIYGMYHCLNVVTEGEGVPAAVLIRGAEPVAGIESMRRNYEKAGGGKLTDGPGKLCRALGLTRQQNGLDLVNSRLFLEDRGYRPKRLERSSRIGIKKGRDKEWRFFESDAAYVSSRPAKTSLKSINRSL